MSQGENHIPIYEDQDRERKRSRCDPDRLEPALTARLLEQLLPAAPARILVCGGGSGRCAIELARRGYLVTRIDSPEAGLELAHREAGELEAGLERVFQSSALDLSRFADDEFEAVIQIDPLFHPVAEPMHQRALAEARRVLRPGGRLLAFSALRLAGRADKTQELLWEAGLEVEWVYGLQGRPGGNEEGAISAWTEIHAPTASGPQSWEGMECLLVVSIKPAWRNALRRIAQILAGEGIEYCIAGGASVVLQGVRLPVKDLDIEMSGPDAYRFQELFASQARLPVAYREDVQYRSHFGVFEIDGVSVDVSGDLERREGEAWAPTRVLTRRTVDLEGVPVQVSWLEEEILAYIRRGRLERAAQCLLACDRDKLLQLLRGEHPIGVI